MCACGCAYYIQTSDGQYNPPPSNPFTGTVNFSGTPTAIQSQDQLNACLVGQNADGIIVAFRGTLPPDLDDPDSVLDWLQDFFAAPTTGSNVPGKVHSGFYQAVMSILTDVNNAVQTLLTGSETPPPVYVTGHSKGGAMASISAYVLSQSYQVPIQQVVTFASPKPGDGDFQTGYESVIGNQVRYENYGDIVPLLPPSDTFIALMVALLALIPDVGQDLANLFKSAEGWDYQAVGSEEFITENFDVISNESWAAQTLAVFLELGEDLLELNFSSLGDAHSLQCGYGYMSGTCPGVCDTSDDEE